MKANSVLKEDIKHDLEECLWHLKSGEKVPYNLIHRVARNVDYAHSLACYFVKYNQYVPKALIYSICTKPAYAYSLAHDLLLNEQKVCYDLLLSIAKDRQLSKTLIERVVQHEQL